MTGHTLVRRKSIGRDKRLVGRSRRQWRDMNLPSYGNSKGTNMDIYRAYFEFIAESPADELMLVKDLVTPLIKTTSISLPFDMSEAVADNCLSLSGMGYYLGVGGCCPTCVSSGDPRLGRNDRAALILAYVQQINNIYHYRIFLASIIVLGDRLRGDARDKDMESILTRIIAIPELFFAYYVLLDSGIKNVKVLFYLDREAGSSEYMMYIVFPGKALHLHYRLIDCMKSACKSYRIIAHVWRTNFLLVIRKEYDRQTDSCDVPAVNAEDVYCKLCDLNIDGELLLEYGKLYSAFDEFLPPR
ncbi:UL31 [Gallid alphaherpesvirus 2]|uniref:Nuclear egress protein 1 n=2 Tax=Gallid alphaherpesvirus 2 TaxID=10390 RepID=NEC1_GAHVM|nr:nuclear egress lamina protein [Gallid alphaherpesvirus 2]Q9E6N8.1 RecName: Full=Nuclear egress protein 1 [Marek's disease herpesvirus type 1 strain MD5]ACF49543.1 UL31 [synthetic construct]AAG14224.1 UL31 nuclear phosphoprotein-like protein [Gallid alphaherpesvirus 2]AAS01672.1 nuclear phosphoprotein [Gallid alphaherpesvirus 2]ABF72269.1 HSV-1 UL31-like protein [Gallid alphaherpesvirus 2]ABR13113.1 UL31 [Gallid alphaherpesvirus 2]